MIEGFRHKGLRLLFEDNDRSKIRADHAARITLILSALEQAGRIEDMNQPTFRLHPLKGRTQGFLGRDRTRQLADHFSFCRRPCERR
jgi:toxin HigB-1